MSEIARIETEASQFTEQVVDCLEKSIKRAKNDGFTSCVVVLMNGDRVWVDHRFFRRLEVLGALEQAKIDLAITE